VHSSDDLLQIRTKVTLKQNTDNYVYFKGVKFLQKHRLTVEIIFESTCIQKPQSSFLTMLDNGLFTQLMTFLYVLHKSINIMIP